MTYVFISTGVSIPSGMFPGGNDALSGSQSFRGNMPHHESDGDISLGGNLSGINQNSPMGIGMGKGMGKGKGKGIGIGMGKGGKGTIASMGFAHPSHRLALLSGQVHQALPPSKIVLKMRSAREEELIQLATAASIRDAADKEAESIRQSHLQVIDREQQIAYAAAQSAASAARLLRQRPLYSLISQGMYQGGGVVGGMGSEVSPRIGAITAASIQQGQGPGQGPLQHSSPSAMHLHNPLIAMSRVGSQNQLPQMAGGIASSGIAYSMSNFSVGMPAEKDGMKPMAALTASAVLTAAMRVRHMLFTSSHFLQHCTTVNKFFLLFCVFFVQPK